MIFFASLLSMASTTISLFFYQAVWDLMSSKEHAVQHNLLDHLGVSSRLMPLLHTHLPYINSFCFRYRSIFDERAFVFNKFFPAAHKRVFCGIGIFIIYQAFTVIFERPIITRILFSFIPNKSMFLTSKKNTKSEVI